MTRALVVTLPERGHYHPLLGPAAELERRGLEVAWTSSVDIAGDLTRAGVGRVIVPPGAPKPAAHLRGAALAELLRDPSALRGWIRELLVEGTARALPPVRAAMRAFRPDVVAIDTMAYEGAIAAELEGVPWVGWATSLNPCVPPSFESELLRTLRALDPQRHALFAAHGIEARFRVSDVLSPRGTAVFSTPALVGDAPATDVHLVGPSLGGRRDGDGAEGAPLDRPLVYASFGSQAWHQPRRFQTLIAAAARLDVDLLLAMGDLAASWNARGDLPPRVRCVAHAAQLDVLGRASLLVTHAGANSVMEALAAGVPVLASPICNDQPHNVAFLERAGAGRHLDLDAADAPAARATMAALLDAGAPERAAASRIRDSYAAHDGAVGAAELALRALP